MTEEVRVSAGDRVADPAVAAPSGRSDVVLYEVRESGVAVVTLNRPERMNAWGGGLAAGFYAALDAADADPAVRVVVLTGSGRAFCAGADMGDLSSIESANTDDDTDIAKLVDERHPHYATTLRKPIIAAINGACAGIGLLLTGRVFSAEEAAAPEDLLRRAIAYAEDIAANCAPSSLAVIKRQVYGDTMADVFDASAQAEKLMGESMLRPDFIEGITAFFEKRPPTFPPLKGQES
jgi:enoyl-CoA hydratase/carnithine racemase